MADKPSNKKPGDQTSVQDLENYVKMQEPHEDADAANENMRQFFTAIGELRKKFRIAEVSMVVQINSRYDGGRWGSALCSIHYGMAAMAPILFAYGLGDSQARSRQLVAELAAGSRRPSSGLFTEE